MLTRTPKQRPDIRAVAQVLEGLWQQAISAEQPTLPPSISFQPKESKQDEPIPSLHSDTSDTEFKLLPVKSHIPSWLNKQSARYTVGVKIQQLRHAVVTDPHLSQELSIYIAPNGQSQAGVGQPCDPLYPWVAKEFLQGPAQMLVLQGVGGAGKSTFNRHLLRALWQDPAWQAYRPGDPAPKALMPLFIPLSSAQVNPHQLWDYYRSLPEIGGFTRDEIRELQGEYRTLWIADGYDEIPGHATLNLYDANHLYETEGRVKLIIGCRSQRVQALNEADSLVPHTNGGAPNWSHYRMRHLSPFTSEQTQDYIAKYVTQHQHDPDRPKDWDKERYQRSFATIPELSTLIDTPFMLWMSLSILPTLTQVPNQKKTPSETKDKGDQKESKTLKSLPLDSAPITRATLYDRFMDLWFTRQARKAWQQRNFLQNPTAILGKSTMQALKEQMVKDGDDVQVYWLKAAYRAFCISFAQCLVSTNQPKKSS